MENLPTAEKLIAISLHINKCKAEKRDYNFFLLKSNLTKGYFASSFMKLKRLFSRSNFPLASFETLLTNLSQNICMKQEQQLQI